MAEQSNLFPQPSDLSPLQTSHSQVLAAVDSLSNPSEPPDIRNWFSSYAYESPALNSDLQGYGFEESGYVEKGIDGEEKTKGKDEKFEKIGDKDGLILVEKAASIGIPKSNNPTGDDDHRIKNASQVIGSSDSLSLSSVDTSDAFEDSVSKGSESERVPYNAEKCSHYKGENFTECTRTRSLLSADKNTLSHGLAECKSYATDKSHFHHYSNEDYFRVEGDKLPSVQNELPVKMISEQDGKPTIFFDDCSIQKDEKSCLDYYQVPIPNNRESPKMSTPRRDSGEITKPACGINSKENKGTTVAENGFVSTRNKRRERANHDGSEPCLRNGVTDSLAVVRKPLSEMTNNGIRQAYYSEITGKWKCPRKGKPNLQPPMKQLRLEQWVHSVTGKNPTVIVLGSPSLTNDSNSLVNLKTLQKQQPVRAPMPEGHRPSDA